MSTIKLKQELIERISGIDDIDFLKAIKTIMDYKQKEPFLKLSPELEKELLFESKSAKKSKVVSQDEIDKKVSEWLKEK
ncbi:MAG: hypothetical protein WD048_17080 [Chitinophagales bacterium]